MKLMKRYTLFLFIALTACLPALADRYADALSAFTSSKAINAPQTSVLVIDLESGRRLVAHNADKPFVPASIMKAVTTATLLDRVGSKYRYKTPVYYTGDVSDGILNGNLVVKASGDPSINTKNNPGSANLVQEIVDGLKNWGIREVRGEILIDESDFPGNPINSLWQPADLQYSYGTGTHGFNFEDNASGKNSVKDPAGVFRARLKSALASAGIKLTGVKAVTDGPLHELGTHTSEQIDEIMRSCMMRSDNQFAEAMLRTVGYEYGGVGSTERGVSEEINFWKESGADLDGINIVDGSGLSRSNRMTASFMGHVLDSMKGNPYYASFFPLAGQEGTLKTFLVDTPLQGEIALKTGSMNGIQCYAGYKLDKDYAPTHAVVVIMNDIGPRAAAKSQVEKLLLSIFEADPATMPEDSLSLNHDR